MDVLMVATKIAAFSAQLAVLDLTPLRLSAFITQLPTLDGLWTHHPLGFGQIG